MRLITWLVIVLLSLSLVTAVSITSSKTDYNHPDVITFAVSQCTGTSVVQIKNTKSGFLVDMDQGSGNWNFNYNTDSDSSKAKYEAFASCDDLTSKTFPFCVDKAGCTIAPTDTGGGSPSSGGGGGGGCSTKWLCGDWSFCNATLQQGRSCTDIGCKTAKPRLENKSCAACDESWVCDPWSACTGSQTRICRDEHSCGSSLKKPQEYQTCSVKQDYVPPPKQDYQKPTPPVVQKPAPTESKFDFDFKKIWEDYMVYILGSGGGIILLIIILVLVHVLGGKKKLAFHHHELKEWMKKEEAMGTSLEDMKSILSDHTGWSVEELERTFRELEGEGYTPGHVPGPGPQGPAPPTPPNQAS